MVPTTATPWAGYTAILVARARTLLQYRAAALAAIGTRLFWGLIRVMIFEAFYRSAAGPQPMSLGQVVTYVWLGQGMLALILWRPDAEVQSMLRTGSVAYELLRPVDLYGLWYARSLAGVAVPTLAQAVPVYLLAWLLLGMQTPATPLAGAAFVLAVVLAMLLSAAVVTLLTISMLWTLSGEGLTRMAPWITYILSGVVLPLPLFPDAVRVVLEWLPFRGLIDIPFRLYLGMASPDAVLPLVGIQVGWILLLVAAGRWLLARGVSRLVVQGG